MPHWPQQQGHALVLRVTKADRPYAGFDLSLLNPDLAPYRVVTAADIARDGLAFPDFYGDDMLLPGALAYVADYFDSSLYCSLNDRLGKGHPRTDRHEVDIIQALEAKCARLQLDSRQFSAQG